MSKEKNPSTSERLATLTIQVEEHNKLLSGLNKTLNDPDKGVLHRLTKIETKLSIIGGAVLVITPLLTAFILFALQKVFGGG